MSFNVDEFLKERVRRTERVAVLLRQDLIDERDQLLREWMDAKALDERENRTPQAPKIQKRVDALNEQIEASAQWFEFGEIGRYEYEKLLRRYPAKGADKASDMVWDPEEFPPALMAATSVDPKLSLADATKLFRQLPRGDAGRLFNAALSAQFGPGDLPLAFSGTGRTRTTGEKSGTADLEESQEASS